MEEWGQGGGLQEIEKKIRSDSVSNCAVLLGRLRRDSIVCDTSYEIRQTYQKT